MHSELMPLQEKILSCSSIRKTGGTNGPGQIPLSTMEMRLSILWKPLLTQYTLSEAHRNAQCEGSRPGPFVPPVFRPLSTN